MTAPQNDVPESIRNGRKYLDKLREDVFLDTNNPQDKHHLGRILLHVLRRHPEHVFQIDANTGQSETNESFCRRTIQTALVFRSRGLKVEDAVSIMGPNHLDLAVPFTACQYDGIMADPIDRTWKEAELTQALLNVKPKIIFCQYAYANTLKNVVKSIGIDSAIVTFDASNGEFETFEEFLACANDESAIKQFSPSNLDPEKTIAVLLSTSGSTGPPKKAAYTHKTILEQIFMSLLGLTKYPKPTDTMLLLSPLQWLSGCLFNFMCICMVCTKIQTSAEMSILHTMKMIEKYKTSWTLFTPPIIEMLTQHPDTPNYDLTPLSHIIVGGSALPPGILEKLTNITKGKAYNGYASTESGSIVFNYLEVRPGSSGRPHPYIEVKIADVETGKEKGPNEPGELLIKSECILKEYYHNPEATKEVFTEDGFVRSGDIFYRDEDNFYYFVDRAKFLLKYLGYQISASEVENVIKEHPGVSDAAVTGVPHPACGDLVVACVVKSAPDSVNEDDLKDLVKGKLADSRQLRGGVLFMDNLPTTSTFKLDRSALKKYALQQIDVSSIKLDL